MRETPGTSAKARRRGAVDRRARRLVSCALLALVATMLSTAAASADGTVMAWGGNGFGELGDGSLTNSDVPVPVSLSIPVGVTVTEVASGAKHSLALLSNGTVLAWGNDEAGQLGDGALTSSSDVPVPVCAVGATAPCSAANGNILTGVTAITAGSGNSLALLNSGTVVGWGENFAGSLGIGNAIRNHDTPLPVCAGGATAPCSAANGNILTGVTAISTGFSDTFALLNNQTVVGWGNSGTDDTLGDGVGGNLTGSFTPVPVCAVGATSSCVLNGNALTGVTEVKAGGNVSVALLSNGTVVDWGRREGFVTLPAPAPVSGLSGVTAVAAGNFAHMALLGNGTVMGWGGNDFGELGDGTDVSSFNPTAVCAVGAAAPCSATNENILTGVTSIAYDEESGLALAVLSNTAVVAWGVNEGGGLGVGTETGPEACEFGAACSRTPLPVAGLGGATAISATGFGGGVAATLLSNTGSGHSMSASTPASVTDGPLSATASGGAGTVTVGQYAANPAGFLSFTSSGEFIDVNLSPGNNFTNLTFEDCELNGGVSLKWWNPHGYNPTTMSDTGEWETVKRQSYDATSKCVAVEIEASGTEPTLEEMSGTIFAAALATTVKPEVTVEPEGKAVTAGEGVSFTAEASGNPAPTVQWWVSKHGGAFEEVAGATADTYTIASTATSESGDEYEAVFKNSQGEATSTAATLTVNPGSSAPVNTGLPQVSGTRAVGKTLACSSGSWSGNPVPTFVYQWSRDGVSVTEPTSSSSYRLRSADLGHTLTCAVTASSSAGSASATSAGALVPLAGCSDYWISTSSGSWYTGADWSTGSPPGAGEEACILTNGTYTVALEDTLGGVSVHSLKLGGELGTQTLELASTCAHGAELAAVSGATIGPKGAVTMTNGDLCASDVTLAGPVSDGGTLSVEQAAGGARLLAGSLTNTKRVSIAAGATLQVTGSYLQGSRATLQTSIAGIAKFGALAVAGSARIEGGAVSVQHIAPFLASLGDEFALLTSSLLTGTFATGTGEQIAAAGLYYKPSYSAGGVTLDVSQAALELSATSGAPGSRVMLSGGGYIPGDTVTPTFSDHGEKTSYPPVLANDAGEIETEVVIPALAAEGAATIAVRSTQTHVHIQQRYRVT